MLVRREFLPLWENIFIGFASKQVFLLIKEGAQLPWSPTAAM
jgi:hypothetical protein